MPGDTVYTMPSWTITRLTSPPSPSTIDLGKETDINKPDTSKATSSGGTDWVVPWEF